MGRFTMGRRLQATTFTHDSLAALPTSSHNLAS